MAPCSAATRSATSSTSGSSSAPSTSVAPGLTTASFSPAMSASGRAQPAGVLEADAGQDLNRRGDHAGGVIAAAEPGLDHRHLDPPRGQLAVGGGGQHLELGDAVILGRRAIDELRGAGGASDGGAEALGLEVPLVDPDPLAEGDEVRRYIGARCAARGGPGSRRSSASSRTCRWCPPRGSSESDARDAPERSSGAASGPARSACRTAPASAGSARPRSRSSPALRDPSASHRASSSACSRRSFSRSASTTASGALATKPCVGQLALGRARSRPRACPGAARAGARRLQVEAIAGQDLDAAAGDRHRGHDVGPVPSRAVAGPAAPGGPDARRSPRSRRRGAARTASPRP